VEQRPGILRRLLKSAFIIANVLATIWLLLCLLAAYTSPAEVKNLGLFSLTIPFAIVVNLFFVVFWLFTSKKIRSLYSLIALLICYKLITIVFGLNYTAKQDWEPGKDRFKLMSWNVHGLGLFNKPLNKEDKKRIADIIKEESPDVVCLPEYAIMDDGSTAKYTKRIADTNKFVEYKFNMDNSYGYHVQLGTMVFSKYPLIDFKSYHLGNLIYLVQSDVQLPAGKKVRLFFVHLYSFNLTDNDRTYIEKIRANKTELDQDLGVSKTFISKFNNSWAIRAKEADSIASIISKSPYPVFICGDFNDLPGSYTYTTIRCGLNDVFSEKGTGLGRTYNQIFGTLRIDHMFYDKKAFDVLAYRSYFNTMSDHNPIVANFRIK
jgi:endonuclease/exonuclease/phosphatase family metal-dependent hydrolase